MHIEKVISGNVADADIQWYRARGPVNIKGYLTAGSGTVAIKVRVRGAAQTLQVDQTDETFTADFCEQYNFVQDDVFGIGVSGASGLTLHAQITGAFDKIRG